MPEKQAARIKLLHGSLMYRDRRLEGFDAAAVVEVVEHLDPPRLSAFERAIFEFARPGTVVITTPNREYNVTWENVGAERLRHPDHRFEWTRQEFRAWAEGIAERFGYSVEVPADRAGRRGARVADTDGGVRARKGSRASRTELMKVAYPPFAILRSER